MKYRILKIAGVLIALTFFLSFYLNSPFFIERQSWKYAGGIYVGDWLAKNTFDINNGIIETTQGKAKVVFCYGKELVLEDLETGEKGHYINKD
jgi:hypothetical protein